MLASRYLLAMRVDECKLRGHCVVVYERPAGLIRIEGKFLVKKKEFLQAHSGAVTRLDIASVVGAIIQ